MFEKHFKVGILLCHVCLISPALSARQDEFLRAGNEAAAESEEPAAPETKISGERVVEKLVGLGVLTGVLSILYEATKAVITAKYTIDSENKVSKKRKKRPNKKPSNQKNQDDNIPAPEQSDEESKVCPIELQCQQVMDDCDGLGNSELPFELVRDRRSKGKQASKTNQGESIKVNFAAKMVEKANQRFHSTAHAVKVPAQKKQAQACQMSDPVRKQDQYKYGRPEDLANHVRTASNPILDEISRLTDSNNMVRLRDGNRFHIVTSDGRNYAIEITRQDGETTFFYQYRLDSFSTLAEDWINVRYVKVIW